MTITIEYGLQKAHRDYNVAPTVLAIKQDRSLRAELGYGDNVRVRIGGVDQPDATTVPMYQGCVVEILTLTNTKA